MSKTLTVHSLISLFYIMFTHIHLHTCANQFLTPTHSQLSFRIQVGCPPPPISQTQIVSILLSFTMIKFGRFFTSGILYSVHSLHQAELGTRDNCCDNFTQVFRLSPVTLPLNIGLKLQLSRLWLCQRNLNKLYLVACSSVKKNCSKPSSALLKYVILFCNVSMWDLFSDDTVSFPEHLCTVL